MDEQQTSIERILVTHAISNHFAGAMEVVTLHTTRGLPEPEIWKHINGCAHEKYVFEEFKGIEERTKHLEDGVKFSVSGTELEIEALFTPGHKTDHMGYLLRTDQEIILFPGDAVLDTASTSCDNMIQYWRDLDRYQDLKADFCYLVHTHEVTREHIVVPAAKKIQDYIDYNKRREASYVMLFT